MRRIALALLAAILLLAAVLLGNTLRQGSRQMSVPALAKLAVDRDGAAASLAAAVRAKTVSGLLDPQGTAAEFAALHAHLRQRYPLTHEKLTLEVIGGQSLLYTWKGSQAALKAIALMAHQDVVPIAPGTEQLWKQPPFEGKVEGGMVWGRGAWDNKGNLIAQLEAVEMLLKSGFQPQRTVHLIFGHDEEVGGKLGAVKVAEVLEQRGVKLESVIDEGLVVTEGILPGVVQPIALIGVAEKGYMSMRLAATATPGHSSMPPAPGQSAIGMLSQALAKLDTQPVPGGIQGVAGEMFATLAPELPFGQRLAMSNLWLLKPVVEGMLSKGAATNALMRTTTAMTIVNAGNKENVLPGRAEAVLNFRLLPGDSPAAIEAHVRRAVADERITIERLPDLALASPVSSSSSEAYKRIERAVREVFPDAMVAPGLMLGGTDGRHFGAIAENVYRFTPIRADSEKLKLFHGTDERIGIDSLADMIRFYHRLVQLAASAPSP